MPMRETETPKVERIVVILLHLIRNRTRRFTAADIHRWLNQDEPVSLRNVQRDLKKLAETRGSHIETTRQRGRLYYFVEPDMRGKLVLPVERNSLLALFMLKRLQPLFAPGARTLHEISQTLEELGSESGDELFEDLDQRLEQHTHVLGEQALLSVDDSLLDSLLTAVLTRQRLRITYRRAIDREPAGHEICPVKFVQSNNELYMVAVYEPSHATNYYFKVCRVVEAHLTGEPFELSEKQIARIERRLHASFGLLDQQDDTARRVVLRFPDWFGTILSEKRFHPSQKTSTDRAGNTLCTFQAPIGDDLVSWVLSWGDLVTVKQPVALRRRVREVASGLARRHR
jgi:predicted DNA-binding transcriptional regulator YafY